MAEATVDPIAKDILEKLGSDFRESYNPESAWDMYEMYKELGFEQKAEVFKELFEKSNAKCIELYSAWYDPYTERWRDYETGRFIGRAELEERGFWSILW